MSRALTDSCTCMSENIYKTHDKRHLKWPPRTRTELDTRVLKSHFCLPSSPDYQFGGRWVDATKIHISKIRIGSRVSFQNIQQLHMRAWLRRTRRARRMLSRRVSHALRSLSNCLHCHVSCCRFVTSVKI